LCREKFTDLETYRFHLKENPECKKFVQDQNKRRKEEKRRRKRKMEWKDGQMEEEKEGEDKPVFKKKCPICLDEYSVEVINRILKNCNYF
jgi:hypothetical protein